MKKMMKNENGFTLIELIIVIAILAIIAAIAIPNILGAVDNSRISTDIANAKIIANSAAQVMAKDEDASQAGFAVDSGLILTGMTSPAVAVGDSAEIIFQRELFKELNGNMPIPKYKGTVAVEDTFVVEIVGSTITVFAGAAADDATRVQLYPTPDATAYATK